MASFFLNLPVHLAGPVPPVLAVDGYPDFWPSLRFSPSPLFLCSGVFRVSPGFVLTAADLLDSLPLPGGLVPTNSKKWEGARFCSCLSNFGVYCLCLWFFMCSWFATLHGLSR